MDRSDAYDRRGAANMMYRETFKCSRTNTFLVELFFEKNYIENYTFFHKILFSCAYQRMR